MIDAVNVIHDRVEQLAEEFKQNKADDPGFVRSAAANWNLVLRRELLSLVANIQRLQAEDAASGCEILKAQHIDC